MSRPAISPCVTGPATANGKGPVKTVARSKIHTLYIEAYSVEFYETHGQPTTYVDRHAVLVVAGTSSVVRVADFAREAQAVDYITHDPDGYLA